MIPHHASAILMCQQAAALRDAQVADLCQRIVANQEFEIREMKEKLRRHAGA